MKPYIFILLTIFIYTKGYSQNTTVTGKIKDQTGNIVAFAHIIFTDANDTQKLFGCLTNEDGHFEIEIPKLQYNLEISVIGLKSTIKKIDLRLAKNKKDIGEISIDVSITLEEVVITANTSAYKIELDKKVYTVTKDISNNGGSLVDVMENVPSVQVEVDGNISIRGNGNVRILIDGKISGLTNTTSLLKTIPAGSIDKIEVITNPSSKYSSEGTGGIINVVLKKGKKKMLSSSVEVFSGIRLNSGTNFNINKRNEKYSWYLNSGLGYSEPKATNKVHVENFTPIPNEYFQDAEIILKQFYFTNNIGGQLSLNSKNIISTDITYRIANLNNTNNIEYQDIENNNLLATSTRLDDEKNKNIFFQISSEYKLKLNEIGSQLKISLLTQSSSEKGASAIIESNITPISSISANDFISNDVDDNRYNFAIDYVNTGKDNSQFELGFRNRNTNIKNNFSVERTTNNISTIISEFTDQTTYKENVIAFYSQYAKSYKKFKFQIGLRTETTNIDILSNNNTETTSKNYTDVFPSSFFDYQFNDNNSLRFSFSRRIQRPRRNTITPFNSFSDSRNIFAGNPEINPSYVILVELGYQTKISNNLSITPTLFYRSTKDVMHYLVQNEEITFNGIPQNVFVTRTVNIGDNNSLGIEVSTSYKPFDWLKLYNELTITNFKQTGNFNNVDYNSDGIFIYGRLNMNFTISKSIKFQMQHRFANGRKRGQIESNGIYRMDLGLSKSLFKDNASLTLNMKDIFDTWEWHTIKEGNNFVQINDTQVRTPQFNISFIYRFNQKRYKGKKGRQYDRI